MPNCGERYNPDLDRIQHRQFNAYPTPRAVQGSLETSKRDAGSDCTVIHSQIWMSPMLGTNANEPHNVTISPPVP